MRKWLILSALLACSPLFREPLWGQSPTVGIKASEKQPANTSGKDTAANPSGTEANPFVVDTHGRHQQTPIERKEADDHTAKAAADEDYHRGIDGWTLRWYGITAVATVLLFGVGIAGTIAAVLTLRRIKRQAELMNRQTVLMSGQLKEIKASGQQMEMMLGHAGEQAQHLGEQTKALVSQSAHLKRQIELQESDMMKFVSIYTGWEVWLEDDPFTVQKILSASIPLQNYGESPVSVYTVITFGGDVGLAEAFRFESCITVDIPTRSRRIITARIPLPNLWVELYFESAGIRIPVEVTIRHGGVLGTDGPVTTFRGKLECGAMNASTFELDPVRMVPVSNWRAEGAQSR